MGMFPDPVQSSKMYLLYSITPVYNRDLPPLLLLALIVFRALDLISWLCSGNSFKMSSVGYVFKSNFNNQYSKIMFQGIILSFSKYVEKFSPGFMRTMTLKAAFCKIFIGFKFVSQAWPQNSMLYMRWG